MGTREQSRQGVPEAIAQETGKSPHHSGGHLEEHQSTRKHPGSHKGGQDEPTKPREHGELGTFRCEKLAGQMFLDRGRGVAGDNQPSDQALRALSRPTRFALQGP